MVYAYAFFAGKVKMNNQTLFITESVRVSAADASELDIKWQVFVFKGVGLINLQNHQLFRCLRLLSHERPTLLPARTRLRADLLRTLTHES